MPKIKNTVKLEYDDDVDDAIVKINGLLSSRHGLSIEYSNKTKKEIYIKKQ